ncbi:domino helicase [Acrasis kona]|uniref:Domino helicase n=1 Tax=Acrasis kona TaxID=1008807 RepID=A0AAW2ZEI0_9EUKA
MTKPIDTDDLLDLRTDCRTTSRAIPVKSFRLPSIADEDEDEEDSFSYNCNVMQSCDAGYNSDEEDALSPCWDASEDPCDMLVDDSSFFEESEAVMNSYQSEDDLEEDVEENFPVQLKTKKDEPVEEEEYFLRASVDEDMENINDDEEFYEQAVDVTKEAEEFDTDALLLSEDKEPSTSVSEVEKVPIFDTKQKTKQLNKFKTEKLRERSKSIMETVPRLKRMIEGDIRLTTPTSPRPHSFSSPFQVAGYVCSY